jgi:hypothetical protein
MAVVEDEGTLGVVDVEGGEEDSEHSERAGAFLEGGTGGVAAGWGGAFDGGNEEAGEAHGVLVAFVQADPDAIRDLPGGEERGLAGAGGRADQGNGGWLIEAMEQTWADEGGRQPAWRRELAAGSM